MKLDNYLKELFELLSIPSISAQSEHNKDMEKAANWLQKKLASLRFNSKVLPTNGHPVIYAELLSPNTKQKTPTILIYGHYDVQSPDPLNEWTTDPFKPEIGAGNIYGRGTADDKGQLYTWIAAIEELMKGNVGDAHVRPVRSSSNNKDEHQKSKNMSLSSGKLTELPVNIKFLIEGEEEIGSENTFDFVNQNQSLLSADVCVISDSHSLSEDQPVITYGLRGTVYCDIKIQTLGKDVHSGIYGGNVLNAPMELAKILTKLKDSNNRIAIPNFYDNVVEISSRDKKILEKYPFTEKEVKEETGAEVVAGEEGYSVQIRGGARPALDVNGFWSGAQPHEGAKTIIPATASAKLSIRIVPNQTSKEVYSSLEKYLKKITPTGVKIDVTKLVADEAVIMNKRNKYYKAAEKAFHKVFGKKPVYELSGGSIPVTATFKEILGIDSILMGYGLPDDGLHSPNEKLSLTMFEKGIRTNMEFLKELTR